MTVQTESRTQVPVFLAVTEHQQQLLAADTRGELSAVIKSAAWWVLREMGGAGGEGDAANLIGGSEPSSHRELLLPCSLKPRFGRQAGSQNQLITASALISLATSSGTDSVF